MIPSFVVASGPAAQVEGARVGRIVAAEQVRIQPSGVGCQMSSVAFGMGRQSVEAVIVPLIANGSPRSSIGHSRLRHGASGRYSGPAVASAVG
jgi:hypothetical protein